MECGVNEIGLHLAGLVMRVDLGRLAVGVAHPVLDCPERDPCCGHSGTERMAKLVERDRTYACALGRLAEAPHELRSVKRLPGLRMAEHELGVLWVGRALAEIAQSVDDATSERNRTS